jgi:hypothetical protein
MTSVFEIKQAISQDNFKIHNVKDISNLLKYWSNNNFTESEKNHLSIQCITYWNTKKSKLRLKDFFNILDHYLKYKQIKNDTITIDKFIFTYKLYNKKNIRPENIFKYNLYNIVKKLEEYFKINITINFEKTTRINTEVLKILKERIKKTNNLNNKELIKLKGLFIHDALIEIKTNDNSKSYDIALEYFEKDSHDLRIDNDKFIATTQYSDEYLIFDETKNVIMKTFLEYTIFTLIKFICAANNDKYTLAQILYSKQNSKKRNFKKEIELFNKIINIEKDGKFNFNTFYIHINPKNDDGESIDEKDFIEYLLTEKNIDIDTKKDDEGFCDAKIFKKIIFHTDSSTINSSVLDTYKNMCMNAFESLLEAADLINQTIDKQNDRKNNLPKYVENLFKFYLIFQN